MIADYLLVFPILLLWGAGIHIHLKTRKAGSILLSLPPSLTNYLILSLGVVVLAADLPLLFNYDIRLFEERWVEVVPLDAALRHRLLSAVFDLSLCGFFIFLSLPTKIRRNGISIFGNTFFWDSIKGFRWDEASSGTLHIDLKKKSFKIKVLADQRDTVVSLLNEHVSPTLQPPRREGNT